MANGWWNLDGAIASCVLAYQPIGAADLAASYVNLLNPGTYNLTPGATAPTLTEKGWFFQDGVTISADTGLACGGHYTVILRFERENELSTMFYFAAYQYSSSAARNHGIAYVNSTNKIACYDGGYTSKDLATATSGVACVAADDTYFNGTAYGDATEGTLPSANYFMGGRAAGAVAAHDFWVCAAAIYNAALTAEQVGDLTTAMAALTGTSVDALTAADFTLSAVTFDAPVLTNVSNTDDLTAADFTLSAVTFDGPTLKITWNTPACRTYSVEAESRVFTVSAESRAYVIPAESRGLKIVCNSATLYAPIHTYSGLTAVDFTLSAPTFDAPVLTSKLTDGLVAYWKLDEASDGSGAVARLDTVGEHDLADNNTTPSGTGIASNCGSFASVNSEFLSTAATADLLGGARDWTIDGWFKLADRTASVEIISKGSSRTNAALIDYRLYSINTFIGAGVSNGAADVRVQLGASPANDTWTYFCIYHDATTGKIGGHLNNGLAIEANFTASGTHNPAGNFRIGASPVPDLYFGGSIDEVGRWNRLLTIKERLDRWNNGSGNPHPFTSEILWDSADYPVQSGSFTYSSSIEV